MQCGFLGGFTNAWAIRAMRASLATMFAASLASCSLFQPVQQASLSDTKFVSKTSNVASMPVKIAALKKTLEKSRRQQVAMAYSSGAPYVCSPSGFGQKSHCFLKVAYR